MKLGGKDTLEYRTLFENQAKLADRLADSPGTVVRLSMELFARRIIPKPVRDSVDIRGPQVTEIMRVQPLLNAMLSKIDLNPKRYYEFRSIMLEDSVGVDADVVDTFVPDTGMIVARLLTGSYITEVLR